MKSNIKGRRGIYEDSLQGIYEGKNPKKSSDYKPGGILF
jgi:hypothetical protein